MYFFVAFIICIIIMKSCEAKNDTRSHLYITNLFVLAGLILYKLCRLFWR